LLAFLFTGAGHANAGDGAVPANSGPPWTAQAAVESSYKIKFDSRVNGESYTLFIRVPVTPAPPQGYSVIYVLDGDFNFGTAADVARTLNMGPNPPVMVAIGHDLFGDLDVVRRYALRQPGDHTPIGIADVGSVDAMLRFHDYTLPVAADHRAPAWIGLTPDNVGGVDEFLRVIETEIKPRVSQLVPINTADAAIFGHSIAGLAVLRALFTEPGAFRTFIAASPSIWWDADAVLREEARFRKAIESRSVGPRVLITVGADEPDSPNPPPAFISSLPPDKRAELKSYVQMAGQWSGMVSGARKLAARLAAITGNPNYTVKFVAFAGEDHQSVIPASISRGMWFAFGPQQ
jgi:hypothetical protein